MKKFACICFAFVLTMTAISVASVRHGERAYGNSYACSDNSFDFTGRPRQSNAAYFSGESANASVVEQCSMGYRIPNSSASAECSWYIHDKLEGYGFEASFQEFTGSYGEGLGMHFRNVVGTLMTRAETNKTLILGAHFDTRPYTSENASIPVMGANDGASGVAALLELAHIFGNASLGIELNFTLRFVFFDGEDYGNYSAGSMFYGSRYYASNMTSEEVSNTIGMILMDMVGDSDLQVYRDGSSNAALTDKLMLAADSLGYLSNGTLGFQGFYNTTKYAMIDDHIPFRDRGIPAIDVIDFDYPFWHTANDTPDKVSAESLAIVGTTVEKLIYMLNSESPAKKRPIAVIGSGTPSTALYGENVTFKSESFDDDGTIVSYNWSSDVDGILSTERNFTISNLSLGEHTISLVVTDNDGYISLPSTIFLVIAESRTDLGELFIVPAGAISYFNSSVLNVSDEGRVLVYGKLILIRSHIIIGKNATIEVESMGNMECSDTSFTSTGFFEFVSYGRLIVENCTLTNLSFARPARYLEGIYAPRESGLRLYSSDCKIANSTIMFSRGLGIMCINASPEIISNKILYNPDGAMLLYNSSAHVVGNTIEGNCDCGCAGANPAVQVFMSNVRIEYNNISSNGGDGIAAYYSTVRIEGNYISFNQYNVYLLGCNAYLGRNTIAYGVHGLWADFCDIRLEHNLFARNIVSAVELMYYDRNFLDTDHPAPFVRENTFENNNNSIIAGGIEPMYENNTFIESGLDDSRPHVRMMQKWLVKFRFVDAKGNELSAMECDTKLTNGTHVIDYIPTNYTEAVGYMVLLGGFRIDLSYFVDVSCDVAQGKLVNVTKFAPHGNMEMRLVLKAPQTQTDKLVVKFKDDPEATQRILVALAVMLVGGLFLVISPEDERTRVTDRQIDERLKKLKFK